MNFGMTRLKGHGFIPSATTSRQSEAQRMGSHTLSRLRLLTTRMLTIEAVGDSYV